MSVIKIKENIVYANMIFDYCPLELKEILLKNCYEYVKKQREFIENQIKAPVYINLNILDFTNFVEFELPITDEGKIINRNGAIKIFGIKNIEHIEQQLSDYPHNMR